MKLHKHVIGPATQSGSSQSQPHLPETSASGLWLSIPGTPGYFSSLRPVAQPLSAMRHVARGEMEPRNSRWLLTLSETLILRGGKRPRLLLHLHLFRGGHRRNGVFPFSLFPCLLDGAPHCCPIPTYHVCYHGGITSASAVRFRRGCIFGGFLLFPRRLS